MSSVDVQRMIAIMDKNSNAAPTTPSRKEAVDPAVTSTPVRSNAMNKGGRGGIGKVGMGTSAYKENLDGNATSSNTTSAQATTYSAAPAVTAGGISSTVSTSINQTSSISTPTRKKNTESILSSSSSSNNNERNERQISTSSSQGTDGTDLNQSLQQTTQENLDAVDAAIRDLIGSANSPPNIPDPASPDVTMITSKTDVTMTTSNKTSDINANNEKNNNSSKSKSKSLSTAAVVAAVQTHTSSKLSKHLGHDKVLPAHHSTTTATTTNTADTDPIITPNPSPTASPPGSNTPLKQHPQDHISPNKRRLRSSPKVENPFSAYDTSFTPIEPILVPTTTNISNSTGNGGYINNGYNNITTGTNGHGNGNTNTTASVTSATTGTAASSIPPILPSSSQTSQESPSVATGTPSIPTSHHSQPTTFTTNSSVSSKSTAISHHLSTASQPAPLNMNPNYGNSYGAGNDNASTSSNTLSFYSRQIPAHPGGHGPNNAQFQQQQQQQQEQLMFEQRLCHHEYGVGVRKIHSNGKSQLRFVKCIPLSSNKSRRLSKLSTRSSPGSLVSSPRTAGNRSRTMSKGTNSNTSTSNDASSHALEISPKTASGKKKSGNRSVTSLMGRIQSRRALKHVKSTDTTTDASTKSEDVPISPASSPHAINKGNTNANVNVNTNSNSDNIQTTITTPPPTLTPKQEFKQTHALTWGNKKKVSIPLTKITAVHKGKTTERTKKNSAPSSHVLSLITSDRKVGSLDIEAPTQMDREKFVQAFCIFLDVPLLEERNTGGSVGGSGVNDDLISPSNATIGGGTVVQQGRTTTGGYGSMESVGGTTNLSNPNKQALSIEDVDLFRTDSQDTSHAMSQEESSYAPSTNSRSINASVSHSISTSSKTSRRSQGSQLSQRTPRDYTTTALPTPLGQRFEGGGIITSGNDALLPDMLVSPSSEEEEDLFFHSPVENKALPDAESKQNDGGGGNNYPTVNSALSDKDAVDTAIHGETIKEDTKESKDVKYKSKKDEPEENSKEEDEEDISVVSSLTQGFDQEIVEELHQALNELRSELDASRAEAARAVKVAEQAIQSAESCSSNDWNSTVTHKAAEAAAQAQKRSAEAIAKQRLAEEKLIAEKKSSVFWRKQAQKAEEKMSSLQTKVASADVQRAAMVEELDTEKKKAAIYIQTLKRDYTISENIQRDTLASTAEQNRILEIELDMVRKELEMKGDETKSLQETIGEMKLNTGDSHKSSSKKKFFGSRIKKERGPSLLDSQTSSTSTLLIDDSIRKASMQKAVAPPLHAEQVLKLQAEATAMRKQFELLRRTTQDELMRLPEVAKEWANKSAKALTASQMEVTALKNRLSLEMANRRKLLNEVQDLRGNVRVYCRPRPCSTVHNSIISAPSHEVGLVHREIVIPDKKDLCPMSYEFDRMFSPNTTQNEMYAEMEDLVHGVLEGYNSCIIAYGQTGAGKTHSIIGDFTVHKDDLFGESASPEVSLGECGMHLIAARQLFQVSEQRRDNFKDSFSLTILEVNDEKLVDMIADTSIGESRGKIIGSDGRSRRGSVDGSQGGEVSTTTGKQNRLEIRTNNDGDTVVQGLVSIPVKTYEDVIQVWKESLASRAKRLQEKGTKLKTYEASTHLIATIQVISKNISSGYSTIGKVHFVDMAGSDAIPRRSTNSNKSNRSSAMDDLLAPVDNTNSKRQEWKFVHKSVTHFVDLTNARAQFSRSVPYRNSTLTHVLRDCLEADTKVLVLLCVSPDAKDLQDTVNSMRFGSKIRNVVV